MKQNPRNRGSLGGEMRMRVKGHCKNLSNHTKSNYMHACKTFDAWRKEAGLSNKYVRDHPRESVVQWSEHLKTSGISQSTIHTMVAGCCCGLGIPSNGIVKHGTAMDKTKSLGHSERAQAAREKKSNQDIVRFQMMVGGRRSALSRLTGKCFVYDESGCPCVLFERDKGGKSHKLKIRPEDVEAVKAYFDAAGPNERLFLQIDHDLDLTVCVRKMLDVIINIMQKSHPHPRGVSNSDNNSGPGIQIRRSAVRHGSWRKQKEIRHECVNSNIDSGSKWQMVHIIYVVPTVRRPSSGDGL